MSWNTEGLEFRELTTLRHQERGAALVVALLVMVVCALLGAAAIMTSSTDLQISSQDRAYQRAFANADAGTQWLLSQNLDEMYQSGKGRSELNRALQSLAAAKGVTFSLAPPFEGADDPQLFSRSGEKTSRGGSQFPVYVARIDGTDPGRMGKVRLLVEMRVPPVGEVDRPGGPDVY